MANRVAMSAAERYYILARDAFTCQYCGRKAPDVALHVDHITPVALGGDNDPMNLIATCESCNTSKSASILPDRLVEDLQVGIVRRTEQYAQAQAQVSKPTNKTHHPYIQERPHRLLQQYRRTIVEPLKGRQLHPDKRHALLCSFDTTGDMTVSYHRQNRKSWEAHPVVFSGEPRTTPSIWRPLSNTESDALIQELQFEPVDHVVEGEREVLVHKSNENIHIIQMIDHARHCQVHFLFWTPIKTLEIAIEVNKDPINTYNDEDTF